MAGAAGSHRAVQPAAAAPSPGTATGDQTIERLERIESLRKKGLISEVEYNNYGAVFSRNSDAGRAPIETEQGSTRTGAQK